jgi:hypothetical protein
VCDIWLDGAVCRQRPELCVSVGHMKLFGQRPELWVTFGYMELCVDRYLNCG